MVKGDTHSAEFAIIVFNKKGTDFSEELVKVRV